MVRNGFRVLESIKLFVMSLAQPVHHQPTNQLINSRMNMKSQHLSVLLAALTCLSVSTQALATVPGASSSIDYGNIHGYMTVSNPTILGVSSGSFLQNQAVVAPGAEITLSFDAGVSVTSLDYCPGCIMQEYLAWTGPALAAGATPQQINL